MNTNMIGLKWLSKIFASLCSGLFDLKVCGVAGTNDFSNWEGSNSELFQPMRFDMISGRRGVSNF